MFLAWSQVGDLADLGGRITEEDLRGYRVQWQQPLKVTLITHPRIPPTLRAQVDLLASNLTLLTVPPPGSGAVLAAILNIMQVPAPLTTITS